MKNCHIHRRMFLKSLGIAPALCYAPQLLAADTKPLPLTLYGPPVVPTLLLGVAQQQGRLKDSQPFAVKVWNNPDQLRAGLANRSIEASIVPSYTAANLAARKQGVKLINIMTTGMLNIIARDHTIDGIEGLAGKKIVMPFKNDMPDLVLQALCRRLKIPFARLQVQYTATPPEALMTFLQKRADFALLPEPMVSMAVIRGKQMGQNIVRALDMQKMWEQTVGGKSGIPMAGLMVSDTFFNQNRNALKTLQQDLQQAAVWANSHPKEAAAIGGKLLTAVPVPALQAAIPHSRLTAISAKNMADDILSFFKELHSLNPAIVGGKIPDSSLFAAL